MIVSEVWTLLGILFGVTAFSITLLRIVIREKVDLVDWFTLAFGLFNGFNFSFILWATYSGKSDWVWAQWIFNHKDLYGAYLASSLLFLLSVWVGSVMFDYEKPKKHYSNSGKDKQAGDAMVGKMSLVSWLMLIFAIIGYSLYVSGYGGVSNLLKFAPFIRSGHFELVPFVNPWTFLERFGSFALFSSFVFFGIILSKSVHKTRLFTSLIGFIISFLFSFFVLYARLGRLSLVSYLVVFPIGFLLCRYGISIRTVFALITIFVLVVIIIIPEANVILHRGTDTSDLTAFYANQISFPYVSFCAQMDSGQFRFMKDVLLIPLDILPDRLYKGVLQLDSASDINTIRIKGALKGQDSVSGEVPADLLTFAIIQGGVVGLVVVGLLWGIFLLLFDKFIQLVPAGVREMLYSFSVINISVLTIPYGDPRHFLLENIYFIFGIVAFYLFGVVRTEV